MVQYIDIFSAPPVWTFLVSVWIDWTISDSDSQSRGKSVVADTYRYDLSWAGRAQQQQHVISNVVSIVRAWSGCRVTVQSHRATDDGRGRPNSLPSLDSATVCSLMANDQLTMFASMRTRVCWIFHVTHYTCRLPQHVMSTRPHATQAAITVEYINT